MAIDYIWLLLLIILPLFYKISFWSFLIQLKEYRIDRIKEYIKTPQWNHALFNFWFIIELCLLIYAITIFFNSRLEILVYPAFFYFLIFQNIFVLWKIFRKKLILPKKTWRLVLTLILTYLFIISLFFVIYFTYVSIWFFYVFLISILLFPYLFIFLSVFLSLPIVVYKKRKVINLAISKAKIFDDAIKIWITWSYWKSSVKEFLSQILETVWNTVKTPENINTELWISDLIIKKSKKVLEKPIDFFVAEMGAYKLWEIEDLWKIVNHKYWFLTAIWNQHLALFWNIENTKKGKFEIAQKVIENDGILYINWNNENIRDFYEKNISELPNTIKYYLWKISHIYWWKNSLNTTLNNSDFAISEIIEVNNWITEFNMLYKWEMLNFKTNLVWEHNILNITWILAFCMDIWIEQESLKNALISMKMPKDTLEISKKVFEWNSLETIFINDSYNLSEDWLLAWLQVLNSFEWEKILVIDDILELGKDAKNIHFELWEMIARNLLAYKVLYVWSNYKKYFINWLLKWAFDKHNILKKIDKLKWWEVILFEGRNSKWIMERL